MGIDTEDVTRLRGAVTAIARTMDRQGRNGELTPAQQVVLGSLDRFGPMAIGELAELEHLNPTMLSRLIGRLEFDGLVRRRPDDADRRVVQVEITAAGTRWQRRRREERTRVLASHLAELPDETVLTLVAALPALEALGQQLTGRPANPVAERR